MDRQWERVIVVGGGPAGLAAATMLKAKGITALVLEQADEVGASWRGHYDRLHLHTSGGCPTCRAYASRAERGSGWHEMASCAT